MKCVAVCGLLLSVAPMSQVACGASEWNQEARDLVLGLHNEKRRGEGGCHMNKLVYEMHLERLAKLWAETCVFDNELEDAAGVNMAWDSNMAPENELIENAVNRWFDEKKTYSYLQDSCGDTASCNYTQMVCGSTSKIGCYSTRCANLVNAYSNAWYLVCFYTPKGNWNGEKPYDKSCKSQCGEGEDGREGAVCGRCTLRGEGGCGCCVC